MTDTKTATKAQHDELQGNLSAGEEPPEPEEEGTRERLIQEEKERKLRAADKFGEREQDAILYYKGVKNEGDAPGSALKERDEEIDARREGTTKATAKA